MYQARKPAGRRSSLNLRRTSSVRVGWPGDESAAKIRGSRRPVTGGIRSVWIICMSITRTFSLYWRSDAGPAEVLSLALPLFLSTSSLTVQIFVDRLFLTWYSQDAIAASIPAMCVLWLIIGPLNGIVTYA